MRTARYSPFVFGCANGFSRGPPKQRTGQRMKNLARRFLFLYFICACQAQLISQKFLARTALNDLFLSRNFVNEKDCRLKNILLLKRRRDTKPIMFIFATTLTVPQWSVFHKRMYMTIHRGLYSLNGI